jgi:hypothetical protein
MDHPETQDARDILSTSTTPAATTKFGLQDSLEESCVLDSGWAVKKDGALEPEPVPQHAPAQVEVAEVSAPSKTLTAADPPKASQAAGD